MKKKLLLKNAAILTTVSLLLRTAGIAYKVYISNRVGTEGMGLYQLVLSVFTTAVTFATAGISISIMRLVSEENGKNLAGSVPRSLKKGFIYALCVSIPAMLLVYFGSGYLAESILKDMRTLLSLKLLAFSLPFMSVSACLKGYFFAARKSSMPAMSDILEQLIEMAVFMLIIGRLAPLGLEYGCAAIVIGITISEIVSFFYLFICYRRERSTFTKNAPYSRNLTRRMLRIALPVAGSSFVGSGLRTVENILIPHGLRMSGASVSESLSDYGMVRGMALPLIFYPGALLSSLSSLMIPEISESRAKDGVGSVNFAISRVLWMTLLSAFAITAVFLVYAYDISDMVYNNERVGKILLLLAPLIPLMYIDMMVDGMLKGLDEQMTVLKYNIIDSVIRIALILILVPRFGFYGFIGVMYVSNTFNPVVSLMRILKVTGIKLKWMAWIVNPLLSCLTVAAVFSLIKKISPFFTENALGLAVAICAMLFLYVFFLMLLDSLAKNDIIWLYDSVKTKESEAD